MIDDIVEITEKLREDMKHNVPILDREIDYIIEVRNQSIERIENILDTLLDYSQMGVGEEQFIKLNSYYHTFCPEYSAEYSWFYDEIMDN
ncbi:MAG: hypothetical protein ACLFNK_02770 [Candidatus Woesearchaeota archaeon]